MAAAATGVWSLVAGLFEWLTIALLSTVAVVLEIRYHGEGPPPHSAPLTTPLRFP